MTNTFLQNALNTTTTANGAKTYKSSLSACLDLFSMGVSSSSKEGLILSALAEDPVLATKVVLYLRDVRSGQGNKDIARAFHKAVLSNKTAVSVVNLSKILPHLPEVGSWKDVYNLYGMNSKLDKAILNLVSDALTNDNSLCAKWFPRQSQFHKDYAKAYADGDMGSIRRWVADLTSVVETAMCNKQWHTINYEHVPSRANLVYSKAFLRNDSSRRQDFLAKAEAGKVSIKSSTLYPHEIVHNIYDKSMEALWKALPNYMEGSESYNILPIVDTSSSMTTTIHGSSISCMTLAVALGLYVSERNEGAYKDVVCTFHSSPTLARIQGKTLAERVNNTRRIPWGGNTNLQATFDMLLENSIGAAKKDLPKVILLISDMEFNQCDRNYKSNFAAIKAKYSAAGVPMPVIVFWRVDVKVAQQPVTKHETGAILINGYSPSILKSILSMDTESLESITPLNMMLKTVAEKYPFVDEILG